MEPASVISIAGACLTLVLRTSREINELTSKARRVDQTVTLILARLGTIQATVSQLQSWIQAEGSNVSPQVAADLHTAINACQIVVQEVLRHIERVKAGWLGGRVRHVWDEGQYLMYQQSLDSQTAALGIFLNVILLESSARQRMLLESIESQRTLRIAQDRASIYSSSRTQEEEHGESPIAVTATSRPLGELLEQQQPRRESMPYLYDDSERTALTVSTSSTNSTTGFDAEMKKSRSWLGLRRFSSSSSTKQQLCTAALQGDAALIARLCDEGADVNVRNTKWIGPGSSSTTPALLKPTDKTKANPGSLTKYLPRPTQRALVETSPLHIAAEMGHLDVINTLVTHGGANPNLATNSTRHTPLHVAGEEAVPLLLSLGSEPLARDQQDQLPLHHAAARGQLKAVQLYIQHQRQTTTASFIDASDKRQQTPLHVASRHGHVAIVTALLAVGAYRNAADADGQRPLHLAAQHGHADVVHALLVIGADKLAAATHERRTALHVAASAGQLAVVEVLLAAGCGVDGCVDAAGCTPLHLAVLNAHLNIAAALIRSEPASSVNTVTQGGRHHHQRGGERPLHLAARSQRADDAVALVRLLLDSGADVVDRSGSVIIDQAGQSPLTVACARPAEALDVVKVLLAAGVQVRYVDFRALWRNERLRAWEKTAVHAALNEVASEDLRRDEVEWAIVAV